MDDDRVITIYASVAHLTRQMLAAARDGEWDTVIALEKDCSSHFASLLADNDNRPRDAGHQRRKAELIRRVLDDDARIRLLAEPWLAQLSELIGNTGRQRDLQRTYQVDP